MLIWLRAAETEMMWGVVEASEAAAGTMALVIILPLHIFRISATHPGASKMRGGGILVERAARMLALASVKDPPELRAWARATQSKA
jgi:hypothetical protein